MSFIAVYFFINTTLYSLQITPTEKILCLTAGEELYYVLLSTTATTILQVFFLFCHHIKKCDYTSLVNASQIEVNPGAKFSLQLINHFCNVLIFGMTLPDVVTAHFLRLSATRHRSAAVKCM